MEGTWLPRRERHKCKAAGEERRGREGPRSAVREREAESAVEVENGVRSVLPPCRGASVVFLASESIFRP